MEDECDIDAITAFLEESDSEDDEAIVTEKTSGSSSVAESKSEASLPTNVTDKDAEEFEDEMDDGDLNELDQLVSQAVDDVAAGVDNPQDKVDDPAETETHDMLSDGGEKDVDGQNPDEDDEAHDYGEEELVDEDKEMLKELENEVEDEEVMEEERNDEKNEDNDSEKQQTEGDGGGFNSELIKAEMAAMAERMRQLQEMLEKQTSPRPASVKKTSSKATTSSSATKKSPHSSVTSNALKSLAATSTKVSSKKISSSSVSSTKSSSKHITTSNSKNSLHKPSNLHSAKEILSKSDSTKIRSTKPSSKSDNERRGQPFVSSQHKSISSPTGKSLFDCINDVANSRNSKPMDSKDKNKSQLMSQKKVGASSSSVSDRINPFFNHLESTDTKTPAAEKTEEVTITAKDVFGESDDSDWDELDGGERPQLSSEGRELKKLISGGPKKREAHTPSYDPSILKKPAKPASWVGLEPTRPFQCTLPMKKVDPERPQLNPDTGTVSGKYRVKDEYMQKPASIHKEPELESITDPYCGIRIVNPRISMDDFKCKMAGRSMIKISRLLSKLGTADLQKDNWVTMGVMVHKTEPRQSAAGKTYCIWKLSDLHNCDHTVTFFLFGNVYKEHWKHELGVVIGLLNPAIMDKAEKNQSEVAVTINHPQQLLFMGVSKDLGRCRGTTKAGQPCSNFLNKMQGEYCTYHVQAAYRRSSSKRSELQGVTGVTPKAFQQGKRTNKQECFFYGGNTFTTMRPQKSNKDKVTISKLQNQVKAGVAKVTTMSLHDLKPEGEMKLQMIEQKDKALLDLLSVPSAGAMNFVKHLVKKETEAEVDEKTKESGICPVVTGTDLLKQHQRTILQKKKADPLAALPKLGRGFTSGQEVALDIPIQKSKGTAAAELAKRLAIAKVKAKGGIEREDPNAVKKKLTSPEAKQKIKKRVAEDMDQDVKGQATPVTSEPPRKKSKLLGNIDLNSPEVQQLLKSKSKHTGALAEAEAEHEERYFNSLEKKERMEDKMDSIMEVPVTLIHCAQCDYTFFSAHDRCKQENHVLKRVKGKKRFFKCKNCKHRTISIQRICTEPCKNCGGNSYERVSMLKERSGPKLESEQLSLRGNEEKYVGSVQGKANLNI